MGIGRIKINTREGAKNVHVNSSSRPIHRKKPQSSTLESIEMMITESHKFTRFFRGRIM